jgi:tetratricopeptide (TPR) repeat protein
MISSLAALALLLAPSLWAQAAAVTASDAVEGIEAPLKATDAERAANPEAMPAANAEGPADAAQGAFDPNFDAKPASDGSPASDADLGQSLETGDPFPDAETLTEAAPAAGGESIEDMVAASDNDLLEMELQIGAGEYDLPKAWLTARVEKIENGSHRFDPRLVRPLTLLGDIASREGRYDAALEHYGNAVHVQRVNGGLVSAGQVEIVHREADVYRSMGDLRAANEREEYAYYVLRRAYKPYDEDLLPGIYRLAEWYAQTNNVFSSRALYQHSVDILTANGRGNSPEAIPALEGIAESYKLERFPPYYVTSTSASYGAGPIASTAFDVPISVGSFPQGERALQRIVQIHRENGNDPQQVAESVLKLADWYLLFEKPRRSDPLYEYVYDLLEAMEDVDAADYFAQPVMLHFPAPADPSPPPLGTSVEPRSGFVEVSYEVTSGGFVRSLKTVASEPKGMMDFRVRKSVRASRHRPSLLDGVPVQSSTQTFRHTFSYYPTSDDLPDDRQARAEVIQ